MADSLPPCPVPDCYSTFETWMRDLERARKLEAMYLRGERATDTSQEYIRQLRARRASAAQRRDAADSAFEAKSKEARALSAQWLAAVREDPHQRSAGTIKLRQAMEKVQGEQNAAYGAWKVARNDIDTVDTESQRIERAQDLSGARKEIAQLIEKIRSIVAEAHESLSAVLEQHNNAFDLLRQHRAALGDLTGPKKLQMMTMTGEWVRNAADRIQLAVDDLIKYRHLEFGIGAASAVFGVAAKHFIVGFLSKMWDTIVKLALAVGVKAGTGLYDSFARRGVVSADRISQASKASDVEQALRAKAKVLANDYHIGGATELGAKLFGKQYVVLTDAAYDMLRADFLHALWVKGIDHATAAVEEGGRLLPDLDKKIEEYSKLVAKMDAGRAALAK